MPKSHQKSTTPEAPQEDLSAFQHVSRAPFELGMLLMQLPANFHPYQTLPPESLPIAQAAADHADNANATVLRGLEAIGAVLEATLEDETPEMDKSTIGTLGELVRHLAVEAQFFQYMERNLRFTVSEYRKRSQS